MPTARWNGAVIAESDETVVVDGNHYFPPESLNQQHLKPTDHETVCGWKGTANYYDVVVDEATNQNAAWYYADPKSAASQIKGYVAFWKDIDVS